MLHLGTLVDSATMPQLPQDKDISEAKMQVQGQLAAQYIQDVMQVCNVPLPTDPQPPTCPATVPIDAKRKPLLVRTQKITDKCLCTV